MAISIHVVNLVEVRINREGKIFTSDNAPGITIKDALSFHTEFRINPDGSANTTGYPTLQAYLNAEASAGFQFAHLSQNILITQKLA